MPTIYDSATVKYPEGSKVCRGCEKSFILTPSLWYFSKKKATREDGSEITLMVPTSYCKRCTRERAKGYYRIRKMKPYLSSEFGERVPCAVCGVESERHPALTNPPARVCRACLDTLNVVEFDLTNAREAWAEMLAEEEAEKEAEVMWRADRRRQSHQGNKLSANFTSHQVCRELEFRMRKIVVFLALLQ